MSTEEMQHQLAYIPEISKDVEPFDISKLDVGEAGMSMNDKTKMLDVLGKFPKFFISSGNGLPPPARGAVCDIDVGSAKPIAGRARRVRVEYLGKLFELLKGLMQFGLIQFSNSKWASPIVIVLKKGGKDIRLCIDYRGINDLQDLMLSPMPTLDAMLSGLHGLKWFLSLDNASGFWVILASKRARMVSAFICPLGHFEWTRMAQGLKNAPMLYQRMITNALCGFVDLPPGMETIDENGEPVDMFKIGYQYDASDMPPVANRTSFADDISDGASTWDGVVELTDRILTRLTYFNIMKAACLYEITEDQFASGQVSDAAKETFDDLKLAYASTPILKHANPELAYHVLIYTTDWAISATLCQEYDGILHPVRFCGRVLKRSEPKQPMWAKEILALLRVIDVCYYELAGKQLNVYTQHDAGKWIVKDKFGRTEHLHWAIMLAPWTITFIPVEQLDGKWNMPILLAEQLTPPGQFLSELFEPLRPNKAKGIAERVDTPIPLFTSTEETYVITFDGAIKLSLRAGSYGFVIWKLPEWEIVWAGHGTTIHATVNTSEYAGVIAALKVACDLKLPRVHVFGDSQLVIHQILDRMTCKKSHLQVMLRDVRRFSRELPLVDFHHIARDWNGAADFLASRALRIGITERVVDPEVLMKLQLLNCLPSLVQHGHDGVTHDVVLQECYDVLQAITSSVITDSMDSTGGTDPPAPPASLENMALYMGGEQGAHTPPQNPQGASQGFPQDFSLPSIMAFIGDDIPALQSERLRMISEAQDQERDLALLKSFLKGDIDGIPMRECHRLTKLAVQFELGEHDTLFRMNWYHRRNRGPGIQWAVVAPHSIVNGIMTEYHAGLQGGHFKFQKTYERIRLHFYWATMRSDIKSFIDSCPECNTANPPPNHLQAAPSPGNLLPEYPMHILGMDFAVDLPMSSRGNTTLVVFLDLFTSYLMVKALPNKSADSVAKAFEEVVFRRFGAPTQVRHDNDPAFMGEIFQSFSKMLGQKSMATFAYRPQANGQTEIIIQTLTRAVRIFSRDPANHDWDDWAERITFSINTAISTTRLETPFYLMHGWDPQTTISAGLPTMNTELHQSNWRWRMRKKKLAHLWHGPFRVVRKIKDYGCELERHARKDGRNYTFHANVHDSRLRLCRTHVTRPVDLIQNAEPVDFDTEMVLADDSLEHDGQPPPSPPSIPRRDMTSPELSQQAQRREVREVNRLPVVAVRDSRLVDGPGEVKLKEYEVQYIPAGAWLWVPELLIPATPLIYDFERELKEFNHLAELVLGRKLQVNTPLLDDNELVITTQALPCQKRRRKSMKVTISNGSFEKTGTQEGFLSVCMRYGSLRTTCMHWFNTVNCIINSSHPG
ncbi:hypothetical protein AeMF1_020789 [Aphanomyces euteiches]|nr:hypothetical protein AeMF1_020789 [Aphanomyces euteiches]